MSIQVQNKLSTKRNTPAFFSLRTLRVQKVTVNSTTQIVQLWSTGGLTLSVRNSYFRMGAFYNINFDARLWFATFIWFHLHCRIWDLCSCLNPVLLRDLPFQSYTPICLLVYCRIAVTWALQYTFSYNCSLACLFYANNEGVCLNLGLEIP